MRKILSISLLSLILGFTTVYASTEGNDTKPFVGKWEVIKGDNNYELEMDLYYPSPIDGCYGSISNVSNDFLLLSFHFGDVTLLHENEAEVTEDGTEKGTLSYNPISGQMTAKFPNNNPIVFKKEDKCDYVIIGPANKVNVRSTPVSGKPIIKANRGQSFKFLGKEKGWFKVELSLTDKRIGYISPQYVRYIKDNKIPDKVFSNSYSCFIGHKDVEWKGNIKYDIMEELSFEKKGKQVIMTLVAMRTQPNGSPLSSVDLTYAGEIVGNAIIFTRSIGSMFFNDNIDEMDKMDPYILYYDKDCDVFFENEKQYLRNEH